MRISLRILLVAMVVCHAVGQVKADEGSQPSILFLFADDLCWEALGSTGGEVETPNLDKLAARGMLFPRAYNMGAWNGAVCIASRTMMITGRSVWQAQPLDEAAERGGSLAEQRECWPMWMKAAGYKTYMSGKWHVATHRPKKVFDVVGTVRPGMPPDVPEGYDRPRSRNDNTWQPWDKQWGGYWQGGVHWSEVLRDEATGFLRQAASHDQPFFMYLAFNAPHDPRQAPQRYIDRYPVNNVRVPDNFLPSYPYKDAIGCGADLRDARLAPFPRTRYSTQKNRQEYYALVTHLDRQIGTILDTLQETGQADNTVVFFTGDHGLAVGRHGLMGKQNMYEHSLRAPLIVAGPDLPRGECLARVYLQDIVPTSLELAGVKIPESMYFKSLIPTLKKKSHVLRDVIYGAYLDLQRMAIEDDWKVIWYPKPGVYRLFNLLDDPLETSDLAEQPDQAERLARMKDVLASEMLRQNDPLSAKEP